MKWKIHSRALMERKCYSVIYLIEQISMDLPESSRFMNAKIVRDVLYDSCVQRQKRETITKYSEMKSGNPKKNMSERSFRTRKLVKFTGNVKLMWSQSSDF